MKAFNLFLVACVVGPSALLACSGASSLGSDRSPLSNDETTDPKEPTAPTGEETGGEKPGGEEPGGEKPGSTPPPGEIPVPPPSERPSLTNAGCVAAGGSVVGDPGDGSVHRDDYLCANGESPIATIMSAAGEPIAIEGAVCCGGPPQGEPDALTNAECVAAGGSVVGDPGDGSVHRDDYVCLNGKPPIGTIMSALGEPIPIEGAVCCGTDAGPKDCEQIQCLRAIECVATCGGPVLQSGCCPCPAGTMDSIQCDDPAPLDLELLNTPCGENNTCPKGLSPLKHFGIAGPNGPEFCSCSIRCGDKLPACPEKTSCVTIADGPGEVCSPDE